MNWPKITVVVPSFNQAHYIEETLLSIIDQGYPNLELIVIDAGSTDGSVELIKKFEPHITYWVSEPDGGQTDGLIKGFRHSTGDIQCWLNSDDLHEGGTLKAVGKYFQEHLRMDAVYGNAIWIDADGQPLRKQLEIPFNRFIWMYTYNYLPCQSVFWRRDLYEKVGGLDREFDLAMDADLWIRFADVGRIGHMRQVWSRVRFYPEQKNRRLRDESDIEDLRIRSRYWGTERPRLYMAKKTLARTLRVFWRLVSGCYSWTYKPRMEVLENQ